MKVVKKKVQSNKNKIISSKKKSLKKVKNNTIQKKQIVFQKFILPKSIYPTKYLVLFPQNNENIKIENVKFGFYKNKINFKKLDYYFEEHKKLIKKKDNIEKLSDIIGGDKLVKLTKYLNFYDFTSNFNIGNVPKRFYNIDLNFGWTNAWRKMYEMIQELKLIDNNSKNLTHFDMCGFPGAFIFATNHYVKTKTNIKNYDWHITSYNENTDDTKKEKYLKDKFNLQRKNKDRFLYGSEKTSYNGDITNIDNIKEFIKFYSKNKAQLVSSDCGLKINWDESYLREQQMIKIHFGQFVCGLGTLAKGGHFVMKNYSQMKPLSISIIYLMILVFDKVYLMKPESSRQYGNEIYLIGKNFKDNLSLEQMNDLIELVDKLENSKNINDCLFKNMNSEIVSKIENKLSEYYKHLNKIKESKDKLFTDELFIYEKETDVLVKKLEHLKKCSDYQIKGYFKNYFRKLKYKRIKNSDKLL